VITRTTDKEFDALLLKFGAALRDYDDERVRMSQARSTAEEPPHPARSLLPEFLALAGKDSGGAQGWILENLHFALDDPAERVRIAKETFPKLADKHADEDSALHAIEGIKLLYPDLGEASAMEMARSLEHKSRADEVKAAAMMLQAWIRSDADRTKDPERWKDTMEIYRSVLYTLPRTRAGKEAAGILIGPVEKKFYEVERKWVDTLIELQAAGRSPDDWPRQPMHELQTEYQTIAAAGHHTAQQWVNRLYPAYGQAENQGRPFAYQWLVQELGEYYGDGSSGPWNVLRMDLLTVLYRQYPTEKWVFASLRKLLPQAESVPPDHFEPALQALLDKNQEPRVRALALFALAQCNKMRGDQHSYERAIELFTRVREEYPDSEVSLAAEGGRADLARCMPGQPAPSSPARDADGMLFGVADYKGRVVMLEFWSFAIPPCLEAVPSRAALFEELSNKPFSLIGVNFDSVSPGDYRERARKAGIRWRSALVSSGHPVMADWEIRRYPTTILIDKKGIIRARDLPWNEMVALARKLVDEAE
jgi:thiol-disulfide isomerase/thioredoxin